MGKRWGGIFLLLVALLAMYWPEAARAQSPSPLVPGQYIAVLQPGSNAAQAAQAAAQSHGVQVQHLYQHALRGFAFRGSAQTAQALARNPNVRFISQDRTVQAAEQTLPTGVRRIAAHRNLTARIDGVDERVNVNIAILDTGIDLAHPDLAVAGGVNCSDGSSYADAHGHGSHVAGIAGALDNSSGVVGVAPGARLWSVRVLNAAASGTWSSVICGMDWVAATRTDAGPANDIAVANLSLTGPGSDDGACGTVNADAFHQAICGAVARGVVVVAAAGNNGVDAAATVPAAYGEVITVSAIVDSDGLAGGLGPATSSGADDTLANFSNFGPRVALAAPGVDILSTARGGGLALGTGTSAASPHVAGAAALLIAGGAPATDGAGVLAIRQTLTGASGGWSVAQGSAYGFGGDSDGSAEPLLFIGRHDVAVSSVSAPASLNAGESVPVSVVVTNPGAFAENVTVTLADSTSGQVIGVQSATLAVDGSATLTYTWAVPANAAAGAHTLAATAAPVPGESATTNNSATATVVVNVTVVDRAVPSVTAPASVVQGASTSVQVTVANQGNVTDSFAVTLRDTTAGADIGTQSVTLAAGGSTMLSFTWATTSGTAAGSHTLTATAVVGTGESNTANNSAAASVTVLGALHTGDLDGVSVKLSRNRWKAVVTVRVHNAAHAPVSGATVTGSFRQGTWTLTVSCITGATGACTADSGAFPSTSITTAEYTVTNVTMPGRGYLPGANHDPDGDSNGVTITIKK